jgi:hypothetical protein
MFDDAGDGEYCTIVENWGRCIGCGTEIDVATSSALAFGDR